MATPALRIENVQPPATIAAGDLARTLRNCHEITCSLLHAQLYLMGDS